MMIEAKSQDSQLDIRPELRERFTRREWFVANLYYRCRMTHSEIACGLGITRAAVSQSVAAVRAKLLVTGRCHVELAAAVAVAEAEKLERIETSIARRRAGHRRRGKRPMRPKNRKHSHDDPLAPSP